MGLISLAAHNTALTELHTMLNSNAPRPNGIACPSCGAEMNDTSPNITLTSNPPQTHVGCPQCQFTGTRVA